MITISRGRVRSGRRGNALVLSLIVVLVVSTLAASFLQLTSAVTRRQANAVDIKQAFYLAESGLTEAYSGLMQGKTGSVGSQADPAIFGRGLFWVELPKERAGP